MQKCDNEEHGIEIGYDASGTNDSAPSQTHEPVGDIVGLATIFPPTAREEAIANKRISIKKMKSSFMRSVYPCAV